MDPELLRLTSGADYLIGWLWGLLLGATILLWPTSAENRRSLLVVWGAKLAVALGVMLVYEASYGLDAYNYFMAGEFTPRDWSDVPIGNGTEFMEWFCSMQASLLPRSYHAEKITCAYLGLIGISQFYLAARDYWSGLSQNTLYALAFVPSVLFWSSILGKDPFTLLGIGMFVRGIVWWNLRRSRLSLVYAAAGVLLALVIRSWLGAILIAPLLVFALLRVRSFWTRLFFIAVVLGGLFLSLRFFLEKIQAETVTDVFDTSNRYAHSWQEGGSGQQLETDFTSFGAVAAFLPVGMFTALFRPLPGEGGSIFAILASLENGFLLFLLLRAGARLRRADLREPMVLYLGAFVLLWAAIYGVVSYQNLGSAVRFRLQILPVMYGLLLYLGRKPGVEWHAIDPGKSPGRAVTSAATQRDPGEASALSPT